MISLMAYKDANKDANKNDGQEKENEENTKMFRHITAITCVIKPLMDYFLNNPSPVIYLNASFCNNYGKLLSAMFMDANITSSLSPVTSVVRKPEWITYFTSSHCSDGGRIGRTSIPCIQQ